MSSGTARAAAGAIVSATVDPSFVGVGRAPGSSRCAGATQLSAASIHPATGGGQERTDVPRGCPAAGTLGSHGGRRSGPLGDNPRVRGGGRHGRHPGVDLRAAAAGGAAAGTGTSRVRRRVGRTET